MTWLEITIQIVRTLINDLDSNEYSDNRITEIIFVSAYTMSFEICFEQTYVIDMDNHTISPEPSQDYITLVSLKAAMLIYNGEAKASSKYGFSIQDGPSTINANGMSKIFQDNLKNIKDMYEKAKLNYCMHDGAGVRVVLTPTTYYEQNSNRTNL